MTQRIDALVARTTWATRRNAGRMRTAQRWSRAEIARLHDLVGQRSLNAIARARGRAKPYSKHLPRVHAAGRITLREAAEYYGIAQGTLGQACQSGRLPCRMFGNLRGVFPRDVERIFAC